MRMTTRKRKNIIIVILMIMVVGMTIAYSALNQYLKINGTSNITSNFNIQITNIEFNEESSSNATDVETSGVGTTTASFKTNLEKPGSYAVYDVTVENKGNLDAYLNKLTLNKPTDSDFSLTTIGIEENSKLTVSSPLTFQVKIQWSSYASTIPEEDITFSIELEYSQDTNYVGFPANTILDATEKQLSLSETYNYLDGTYLKGKQRGNYVWFNGFMWRIMGKNADGSIRMITEENVTAIPWGAENTAEQYGSSYANDWLNNYFYPKLKKKEMLVQQTWCSETTTDETSARTTCTNNLSIIPQYVGLISLDEYNLSDTKYSYLVNSQEFRTLTPYSASNAWYVGGDGTADNNSVSNARGVRPVVNVSSEITITGGNGTLTDPYMFEDKSSSVMGTLKDNSQIGEYVTYSGRNYRVVETSESGTKLILDGYYDRNNDGTIEESDKMACGTNCTLCTTINEDTFLNWLSNNDETEKAKLLSTTWYRGDYFVYGDNYKTNLESTSNSYIGSVGLIRVGEMLSGQSETILSKNHSVTNSYNNVEIYWTATPSSASYAWNVYNFGYAYSTSLSFARGLRPVINISSEITITGGNGTPNSPYQLS